MQTSFSAQQLADPRLADAARIIKSCVRHGFCPQTCPTYVLLGDENDSPRGRIDLIRAMLERGSRPDAKTVGHIDRCLSCLACETTCAARVDYRHLIDRGRAHIEQHYRRPWRERLLRAVVANVLPYPKRLRAALWLARLIRPLAHWLPAQLAAMIELLPEHDVPPAVHATTAVLPAVGDRRFRVALLVGCVQQVMGGHINEATVRVLRRHGCEVMVAGAEDCCGALNLHMGREAVALTQARRMIATLHGELERGALDAIVVNVSGCGAALKDYGQLFANDLVWRGRATRIAAQVQDVSEVLARIGIKPLADMPSLPIAYHDACSLQHGQRVIQPPRALLRQAGFDLREIPERHFCCGSAGTYNLLQPALAVQLGERKARAAKSSGAVAIAAGNLGCLIQLGHHGDLPVVHTVELLDWASGGPRPAALARLDLTRFPPRTATTTALTRSADEDEINFWIYAG